MGESSNVISFHGHVRDKEKYHTQGTLLAKKKLVPMAHGLIIKEYHLGKNKLELKLDCGAQGEDYELYRHPDFVAAVKTTMRKQMLLHVLVIPPEQPSEALRVKLFRYRDLYWEHWLFYALSKCFWLI